MFISIKKYYEIVKALKILLSRPYLAKIIDNEDGTVMFEFVQGNKVYNFVTSKADIEVERRILN
jgi:hypothetical protein